MDFLSRDWDAESARLAKRALRDGAPTSWFEQLYAGGRADLIDMPWDRPGPLPLLRDWLARGSGSAVVVGCGLGVDAEFVASRGYRTTAFDISESAVRTARERHPDSPVTYRTADLLDLPHEWSGAFDLVVEVINVQALPVDLRPRAVEAVAGLVAPGGTLLAVENVRPDGAALPDRPPWPFSRADIESFAEHGLRTVAIEAHEDPTAPRWRAEFTRD